VLLAAFDAHGLAVRTPPHKSLHWHVDYLLDVAPVSLAGATAIRSDARLELPIADLLMSDPVACVLAPGLGAADAPGHTHLLRVLAAPAWWAHLPSRLGEGLG
jgi:Uri superfamily endonuclease